MATILFDCEAITTVDFRDAGVALANVGPSFFRDFSLSVAILENHNKVILKRDFDFTPTSLLFMRYFKAHAEGVGLLYTNRRRGNPTSVAKRPPRKNDLFYFFNGKA